MTAYWTSVAVKVILPQSPLGGVGGCTRWITCLKGLAGLLLDWAAVAQSEETACRCPSLLASSTS